MTACTNKARGAVVAALAGVLALGAVPAVALAAGTADAQVGLLFAEEYNKGTFTLSGFTSTSKGYKTTATGDVIKVEVSQVTFVNGSTVQFDEDLLDVTCYATNDDEEKTDAVSSIVDAGTYVIEVTGKEGSGYENQVASVTLTVQPKSLPVATKWVPYEVNPNDSTDRSDRDVVYTGYELNIGLYAKGLTEGEDYEVKYLLAGTDNVDAAAEVKVVDATNYVAHVTGPGKYAGKSVDVPFDVAKFDVSRANIVADYVYASDSAPEHPTTVTSIDGVYTGSELDPSLVTLTFDKDASGKLLFDENGEYKFTASYDVNNKNLTGCDANGVLTNKVTVAKVGQEVTYKYAGEDLQDSYTVDLSKNESFDTSKIELYAGKNKVAAAKYDVDVFDMKGNAGDLTKAGTYKVVIDAQPGNFNYNYAGRKTVIVKVINGTVDADAQVYVTYKDKLVSSVEKTYDGDDIVLGTDLKVVAYNDKNIAIGNIKAKVFDSNGRDVTSAAKTTVLVDAGTYTLKIESAGEKWNLTGTTEMTVTINKVDLTTVKLVGLESWSGASYLSDETEVVTFAKLGPRYDTHMATGEKDGEKDYVGWDDFSKFQGGLWDASNLSIEKWDAEEQEWVKATAPASGAKYDAGDYRLVIKGSETLAKNFEFANDDNTTTVAFKVIDADNLKFTDVTPSDWFFNCVGVMAGNNTFKSGSYGLELVKGYADSNVFGPNDTITRADVAVILYRMAQGHDSSYADPDLGYTENVGWVTGFSDIDEAGLGNMYFAKAVGWANKMGVVNGYDDGTFGPYDQITREELATMLANFAKHVYRDDVALVEGELDAMPDGDTVSTWAQKAVSWCLENELMGNDGSIRPTDTIARAETAAMAYNYLTKVVGLK